MSPVSSPSVLSVIQTALPHELAPETATFDLAQLQGSQLSLNQLPHWLALENWLYHCRATLPQATCLADVTGLIEASYHSCALGQWHLAYQLICWPVGNPSRPLHQQLGHWGHYRQQIDLYQNLRGKLDPTADLQILNDLGQAYQYLGELHIAQEHHANQLTLAQTVDDLEQQIAAHIGLGGVSMVQGNRKLAQSYFQRCHQLALSCQNPKYQIEALLGSGHHLFKTNTSDAPLQQALKIAQAAKEPKLEMQVLSQLARFYFFKKSKNGQALLYLQTLFSPEYCSLLSRYEEASNLRLMGLIQLTERQDQALDNLNQALSIAREAGLLFLQLTLLNDMCVFYSHYRHDPDTGIPYGEAALKLSRRLGNLHSVIHFNANLAIFHAEKGNTDQAEAYLKAATANDRATHQEINRDERAHLLACIARVRWMRGQHLWALLTIGRSLMLQPPWSSANGRLFLQGTIEVVIMQPLKKLGGWLR